MTLLLNGVPDRTRTEEFLKRTGFEIAPERPNIDKNPKFKNIVCFQFLPLGRSILNGI